MGVTYADYRELLDKEDVDAVMVGTPDHTHAVITMAALKRRKHVYCEKPLTHTVHEARQIAMAARESGVATQMGNQGQAGESARVVAETIADGAIGPVLGWDGVQFRVTNDEAANRLLHRDYRSGWVL